MTWIAYILFIAAVIVVMGLGIYIYCVAAELWRAKFHPYYDRELTRREEQFLTSAQKGLRDFAAKQKPTPVLYNTIYTFGFLPAMAIAWGLLYGFWYVISKSLQQPLETMIQNGELLFFQNEVGPSAVIAVFLGILLACYLLYWVTARSKEFTTWMALNGSSSQRESKDEILERRVDGIEDALRLKKLSPTSPFSSEDYLCDIIAGHKRVVGYLTMPLLVLTLVFTFFDLRNMAVFYPDRLESKRYWSGAAKVIEYDDVSDVTISCYIGSKGKVSTTINFAEQSGNSYQLSDWTREIDGVVKLDSIFRRKGASFNLSAKNQNCLKKYLNNYDGERREKLMQILHIP